MHLKWVSFLICKIYLDNTILKKKGKATYIFLFFWKTEDRLWASAPGNPALNKRFFKSQLATCFSQASAILTVFLL